MKELKRLLRVILMTVASGIATAQLPADSQASYDESGTLDSWDGEFIVVDDTAYKISKLAQCYDSAGNKLITCLSLKKSREVGVVFDPSSGAAGRVVVKIYKIK